MLSAFRPEITPSIIAAQIESQCTFWCSVLSDWMTVSRRQPDDGQVSMHLLVLSAFRQGINITKQVFDGVSMHLLVLSAFRRWVYHSKELAGGSQCTFWCSVLSDTKPDRLSGVVCRLNAPFGAQCFPTRGKFAAKCRALPKSQCTFWCSVLSDFYSPRLSRPIDYCLNAPFGAQCFPTLS